MPVHRVLIATDLSHATQQLLRTGLDVAQQFQAETTVFHVFSHRDYDDQRRAAPMSLDAYAENLQMQIAHCMAEVGGAHRHARVEVIPGDGIPEQVLAAAGQMQADLIVVGTHGRTGLARMLMGSVAEAILRRANVPVLIVPTRASARQEAAAS